jgi:adenylate cyclase
MAIWTSEIKELEKLYESLKGQLPELDKELEHLLKTEDENVIMLYSRRCLEIIVTDLCECELKRPRKTEPLKGIIDKLHKEEKVPSHILTSMHGLNDLSTYGTHPKDFNPEQVKPVLVNLDIIFKWYLKYKHFETIGKSKPEEEKSGSKHPTVSTTEKSIAVLPFVNMSPEKDQDYFCDGMAEEIINTLAHIENIKVIARTSAFAFKDKHVDIREIGRILDVETLLEGSVRKAGNQLRITAQLIKVADGSHIWSERYDRDMRDVFAIQDEISLAIVDNLKVMLLGKEKTAILKHHTDNLEAYMFYLKGRQSRQRKDQEDFFSALGYLEKSIELDPEFALAYAETAFTYVLMAWFCYITVNEKNREKILGYANKALLLDERASDAYTALALMWELFDNDQEKGEKFARQAVTLNPGNSEAILEHGYILGRMGNFDAALTKMESAIALDPLSIQAHNGLGHIFLYKGSFKAAIKQAQAILALDPTFFPGRFLLSLSFTGVEEYSNALSELSKCPQSYPSVIAHQGYLFGKMKREKEAIKSMNELKIKFNEDPLLEYLVALIYAGLDDKESAFEWLQRSQNKHGFVYRDRTTGTDYRIVNLRNDPRFSKLIYY